MCRCLFPYVQREFFQVATPPNSATPVQEWQVLTAQQHLPHSTARSLHCAANSPTSLLRTSHNDLAIANALWTKDVTLNPAYAGSMKALFKVRMVVCGHMPQQSVVARHPVSSTAVSAQAAWPVTAIDA
jgi:hypothetical protein